MNVFTALKKIINAANDNYKATQQDKQMFDMKQASIIQERNICALLKEQLEDLLHAMEEHDYSATRIQIAKECEPFINEAMIGMEAELTCMDAIEGIYLFSMREEVLE